MSQQQCKTFIIKKQRRCLLNGMGGSEYCQWHGPLCQGVKNSGSPCNSMVLNFRDGSIYCKNHANVGIERHVGIHEPSYNYCRQNFRQRTNYSKQRKELNESLDTTTITKTKTTTSITTSNEEHLCKFLELLELSKNY
jgi:hypothetical protein